jgi:U3 small nucleolar RNA-associated protein 20
LGANLATTFQQLAPLLGKSRQKHYVRRFASEAFAFLLRRIKGPHEIVETIFDDLDNNKEYVEAITNMFVESIKGPGRTLHSKAVTLFDALAAKAARMGNSLAEFVD